MIGEKYPAASLLIFIDCIHVCQFLHEKHSFNCINILDKSYLAFMVL